MTRMTRDLPATAGRVNGEQPGQDGQDGTGRRPEDAVSRGTGTERGTATRGATRREGRPLFSFSLVARATVAGGQFSCSILFHPVPSCPSCPSCRRSTVPVR